MRGVVRAGAYLPAFTEAGRRVGAYDEDGFTFAATALERAAPPTLAPVGPIGVRALGLVGPTRGAALAGIVGAAVESLPAPTDGRVGTALRAAATSPNALEIVLVVAEGREVAPAGPGEGAVAFAVADTPDARPVTAIAERVDRGDPATPLGSALEAGRAELPGELCRGDWTADPGRGRPGRFPVAARSPALPFTVSQGAFVPSGRDEANRPSRWRFVADRCGACGAVTFPERGRCRTCGRRDGLTAEALPHDGATVVARTWIGPGGQPTEFDAQVEAAGPYGVVLAELTAGVRVTLAVADAAPEEVRVGAKVDTRLRRIYPMEGAWRYGRKAVPSSPGDPP